MCGNTADILAASRYGEHFEIIGDKSMHHGLFPCGPADRQNGEGAASGSCC
ncbi:hypothetical protein [Streptomyces sp. B6B3]|uniref:hypothetical protein n=1 Tax=Streptomyces sp. B6B3 TaxID=3153570 RepID=UPI00325F8B34